MPELAGRCGELHGIDIHDSTAVVQRRLADFGVSVRLVQAAAEKMPYPSGTFDTVIAISSLEFVCDIAAASREISRVLRPHGRLIVVTPGYASLADWGLKLLTGHNAKKEYGDRRERLIPALLDNFTVEAEHNFPPLSGKIVRLYTGLRLIKKV